MKKLLFVNRLVALLLIGAFSFTALGMQVEKEETAIKPTSKSVPKPESVWGNMLRLPLDMQRKIMADVLDEKDYQDLIENITTNLKTETGLKAIDADIPDTLRHSKPVLMVSFSPNNRLIATATVDGQIKVWDITNKKPLATMVKPLDIRSQITALTFNADSSSIAAGFANNTVILYSINNPSEKTILKAPMSFDTTDSINSIIFSKDNTVIITVSTGRFAKIWDARTGTSLGTIKNMEYAALSPDGKTLLLAYLKPQTQVASSWVFKTVNLAQQPFMENNYYLDEDIVEFSGSTPGYTNLTWSPNGESFALARGNTILTFDFKTGSKLIKNQLPYPVTAFAYLTNEDAFIAMDSSKKLLPSTYPYTLDLVNLKSKKLLYTKALKASINSLAVSANKKFVARSSSNGTDVFVSLALPKRAIEGVIAKVIGLATLQPLANDKKNYPLLRAYFMSKLIEQYKNGQKLMIDSTAKAPAIGLLEWASSFFVQKEKPVMAKDFLYYIYWNCFDKQLQDVLAPYIEIKR